MQCSGIHRSLGVHISKVMHHFSLIILLLYHILSGGIPFVLLCFYPFLVLPIYTMILFSLKSVFNHNILNSLRMTCIYVILMIFVQVRSATLDTWLPEQVAFVQCKHHLFFGLGLIYNWIPITMGLDTGC